MSPQRTIANAATEEPALWHTGLGHHLQGYLLIRVTAVPLPTQFPAAVPEKLLMSQVHGYLSSTRETMIEFMTLYSEMTTHGRMRPFGRVNQQIEDLSLSPFLLLFTILLFR